MAMISERGGREESNVISRNRVNLSQEKGEKGQEPKKGEI